MVVKPTDALALLETALAYRFAGFELDTVGGRLWHGASVVPLRRRTWQLLCLFIANPRRLCHKDELLLALWPTTVVVDDSLVQCVVELRRALGDGDRQLIRHVARLGYRFDADVEHAICNARTAARGR